MWESEDMPHGIMFHHFHGANHRPSQGSLAAEELGDILERFKRRIIPPQEWIWRSTRGKLELEQVCLTFDDSLRCQYDVALPVLEALGVKAFWFVYTSVLYGGLESLEIYRYFRTQCFSGVEEFYLEFERQVMSSGAARGARRALESFSPKAYLSEFPFYSEADRRFRFLRDKVLGMDRYNALMDSMMRRRGIHPREAAKGLWLDKACLKRLDASGHVVGMHSHTHPLRVAEFSQRRQRREYEENRDLLARLLGAPPTSMSHPCNSYDGTTLRILRELGIRTGFCSNMKRLTRRSRLEYPREDATNILSAAGAR